MHYLRSAVVPFLILTIILLASCGGGHSSSVGPIATITLNPSPSISMNAGDFIQMSVTATDSKGNAVNNQTITFNSSSSSVAQISTGGALCAGQWQDGKGNATLVNPVVCFQPPSPPPANFGQSNITATAQGVTSNTVVVSVHPRVVRVVVTAAPTSCVSQGLTVTYTAQAFDGATPPNDVTNLVGNFAWTIGDNSTIGTLSSATTTGASNTVTALIPGLTTVTASVNVTNPVTSPAVTFQECPVGSIVITGPDSTNNPNLAFSPSPANVGDTGQLSAAITDTIGGAVTGVTLTWNTSQSAVASVSSSGLATAVAPGTSSITASCALGTSCNKNQGTPVTSNIVTANVTGSSATTVYATGTGTTSLVPIDTTTNTAGTAITLTDKPNSLIFDAAGNNAFLGSPSGLMVVNASSNTLTRTISNALGTVLAVSPNGQFILLGGSGIPTVLYNNTANTVTTLNISNAVAADFSPDGSEIVVADATGVRVVQGTVVRNISATVAKDVSFLATGALAYLAAPQAPSVIVCNNTLNPGKPASGTPTLVRTLPNGSKMLGAELPSFAVIGVTVDATHCPTMPPTITETPAVLPFAGVGGTPKAGHITVTSDGKRAYITSDVAGKLLSYDAVGNATGSVPLVGTAPVTFSTAAPAPLDNGGATSDSAFVYVGVNDGGTGSVHVINVTAGTDAVQIPTNDASSVNFVPDLVAVRPH